MDRRPAPRRFPGPPAGCRRREGETGIGLGRLGGQQQQPPGPALARNASQDSCRVRSSPGPVIHPRPAEIAVGEQKSTGLDDIHRHPQAGAKPHQATRHFAECRADRAPGANRPSGLAPRYGQKRHFLRHRAARPSKFDSLFYRADGRMPGYSGGRRLHFRRAQFSLTPVSDLLLKKVIP